MVALFTPVMSLVGIGSAPINRSNSQRDFDQQPVLDFPSGENVSAFICSDTHINAIVRWACEHNISTWYSSPSRKFSVAGNEQQTAELLFSENVKSVNYRYKESSDTTGIIYDPFAPDLLPIEVIKACDCLAYQSCEHPEWDDSLSCKLLKQIQRTAITGLAGYGEARWEITTWVGLEGASRFNFR